MEQFDDINLQKFLAKGLHELGLTHPTPIQKEAYPVIRSGSDVVGISQTGTGKTLAYLLPILQDLKFSKQITPRVLVLVPTRELVVQVVEAVEQLTKFMGIRVYGAYGGVNINTQKQEVVDGIDVVVATPGRLYDLAVSYAIPLKDVRKLVIDEVDVMLDLGFRTQLKNIFDILSEARQNIMFSATMTDEVDELIDTFFKSPKRIAIAVSGEPLKNINQTCYSVKNFFTKINLLKYILRDKKVFTKVVVFVSSKKLADRLYDLIAINGVGIIHSNKSQNARIETIELFDEGEYRILIATDIIARGLDFHKVTHVINFDVPSFPENYIHRIGRSGRAQEKGNSILFYTDKEEENKLEIEQLMNFEIPEIDFPNDVEESQQLLAEEKERPFLRQSKNRETKREVGAAFHEKSAKNSKVNLGGKYKRELKKKHKKSRTRGDKNQNLRRKKK
ncbi:MAG: DEAD/DEAH box helicase [Flavobacteriales bacterium]|nr:DEAD/DEAH box helicase [Flavobacteriales bacterium]|tara:strand:- start:1349 stop:2692 length:1344 start_codon:yes stop_codon:yes gene_type:complete